MQANTKAGCGSVDINIENTNTFKSEDHRDGIFEEERKVEYKIHMDVQRRSESVVEDNTRHSNSKDRQREVNTHNANNLRMNSLSTTESISEMRKRLSIGSTHSVSNFVEAHPATGSVEVEVFPQGSESNHLGEGSQSTHSRESCQSTHSNDNVQSTRSNDIVQSTHSNDVQSICSNDNNQPNHSQVEELVDHQKGIIDRIQPDNFNNSNNSTSSVAHTVVSKPVHKHNLEVRSCCQDTLLPGSPVAATDTGTRSSRANSYAIRAVSDRDLLASGMDRTNDASRRQEKKDIAKQQAVFALRLYPFIVLFMLVVSVPFLTPVVVLLHRDANYERQCRPHYDVFIALTASFGIVNLCVATLFISQIHRYREHQHIKTRGRYFLTQLTLVVPLNTVFGTLATLSSMGALSGDCLFSYNKNWHLPDEPVDSGWSLGAVYAMVGLHNVTALLGCMFLAAIIARQYLLYKLFVDNRAGAVMYTIKDIRRMYFTPNAIILGVYVLVKVIFWVGIFAEKKAKDLDYIHSFNTSRYRYIIVIAEFILVSLVTIPFAWLSYKTRDVEVEFNDWWANIRAFMLAMLLSVCTFVLRSMTRFNVDAGVFHGPFYIFLTTMYVMDSFSGPLILIYSEDPHAPQWLRSGCNAIVQMVGTGPLRAMSHTVVIGAEERHSSVELDANK